MTLKKCDLCKKLEGYNIKITEVNYPISYLGEDGVNWYTENANIDVCEDCRMKICKVYTRNHKDYKIQ